jgi:hypothetical protein
MMCGSEKQLPCSLRIARWISKSSNRRVRMNARLKQLRDLVVALDLNDRNVRKLPPDDYREAASRALLLTREEMGLLPIADFAGPISALQTLAENIYFKAHGRFADLDATGRATVAKTESRALYRRLQPESPGSAEEIANRLLARMRSRSAA